MNPFDMSATAFLALYVPCGAAVLTAMYWVSRWSEPALPVGQVPTDPCTIACLRGGPTEAISVAALALLERGALELAPEDNLSACREVQLPLTVPPVELVVYEHFSKGGDASSMFTDKQLEALVRGYTEPTLETTRLIPDEPLRDGRQHHLYCALYALLGLAALGIPPAIASPDPGPGALILVTGIYCGIGYAISRRRRTPAGNRALRFVEQTFYSMRGRIQDSARPRPEDVAVVAAVFGLTALPEVAHAQIAALRPKNDAGCGGGGSGNDGSADGCEGGGCGGCGCGG